MTVVDSKENQLILEPAEAGARKLSFLEGNYTKHEKKNPKIEVTR